MTSSDKYTVELEKVLEALRTRRDDAVEWERLYKIMWPYVYGNMFGFLHGQTDDAREASQEAFLRLARYCPFDKIQNARAFLSYVWITCRNVARAKGPGLSMRRVMETPLDETILQIPSDSVDPETLASLRQGLSRVEVALGREDARILGSYLHGASIKEIAARQATTYGNIAVRLHRIRARVLQLLREH